MTSIRPVSVVRIRSAPSDADATPPYVDGARKAVCAYRSVETTAKTI
jgi:hypothetical protein